MSKAILGRVLAFFFVIFGATACGGGGGSSSSSAFPAPSPAVTLQDLQAAFGASEEGDADEVYRGGDVPLTTKITGIVYYDGDNEVQVLKLNYAHLGFWETDSFDEEWAYLADNRVTPPETTDSAGSATYNVEGLAVYDDLGPLGHDEIIFYPDGTLRADFDSGEISGMLSVDGSEAVDDFGGVNFLPDDDTAVAANDDLTLTFDGGTITADGFSGDVSVQTATGVFSDLAGATGGEFSGAFYDEDGYSGTPDEMAGIFSLDDTEGNLRGGFLGEKQ